MTALSGFGPVHEEDLFPVWLQGEPGRIHVRTPFSLKDVVKMLPGGRWDPNAKAWHYPATPAAARNLIEAIGEHRLDLDWRVQALADEARREDDALKHKFAEDLPEIPGRMPAWLHQKRAYHWARERKGSMLGMDMGTGKSRTAISLLDGWCSDSVILVCPRSVMNVWPNQFAQHSENEWDVIVPPTNATVQKRVAYMMREYMKSRARKRRACLVVNYEACWREPMKSTLLKILLVDAPGTDLVLDESHRIKAPGGTASKTCGLFGAHAGHVLCLTGTPMPHSPLDVYGQYRAMDPGIFGTNFSRFRLKYAVMGGWEGKQVVGYQNQDEFTRKFGQACFVVKKTEAGLDLPPVVHVDRTFELGAKSRKAYTTLEHDFILGVEGGTVTTANALVKLLRLQQVTSGYVRDDDGEDRHVGDEKIAELDDVLQDVPEREPVAIFARFKHDIRKIAELCRGQGRRVGIVDGETKPGSELYGLNERSQMRDDVDVIILQLQSGGVGIDLTRAAIAVYYSLDFSLGNYDQTLARLDRPGQKRSVTYIHLIATNTKDEVVYQALQERRDVVEATIAASRRQPAAAA
jgi:SNF2 family DNA or RNA helicase